MPKLSAGLLLYRRREDGPEVFLVHPGGPFWSNKDAGAWSIPKGEPEAGEDLLIAARRKMAEETGFAPPGPFVPLEPRRQKAGKLVHAWAVEGDCDPALLQSNVIEIEWPPRSGRRLAVPEADRGAWFGLSAARAKINSAQIGFLDQLEAMLAAGRDG